MTIIEKIFPKIIRCSRCILPDYTPGIRFDKEGICNYCKRFEKNHPWVADVENCSGLLKRTIDKAMSKKTKRTQYDCLVACSGGKDSVSALYYLKNLFGLNPLVYTFDNNFEPKETIKLIESLTKTLNVDWIYSKDHNLVFYKYVYQFLRSDIRRNVQLCIFCLTLKTIFVNEILYYAEKYEIPMIVSGVGKEEANILSNSDFINQLELAKEFRDQTTKFLNLNINFAIQLSSWNPDYIPFWSLATRDITKLQSILKNELNWNAFRYSYPRNSTNCLLSIVDGFLSSKYKIFSQYENELSVQIRFGEIDRDQAIRAIETPLNLKLLNSVLEKFNLSLKDI